MPANSSAVAADPFGANSVCHATGYHVPDWTKRDPEARERAIVMHGAPYVDPVFGERQGRIGRSWGCPAVREAVARRMIDVLKGGQFLFAYYPDSGWLRRSALLDCAAG